MVEAVPLMILLLPRLYQVGKNESGPSLSQSVSFAVLLTVPTHKAQALFLKTASPCSPHWSGILYVDKPDFKLINMCPPSEHGDRRHLNWGIPSPQEGLPFLNC